MVKHPCEQQYSLHALEFSAKNRICTKYSTLHLWHIAAPIIAAVNSHLQSQPEKTILTIFYVTTLNQAKKLTGGSSVLVYWAGGPPASKHQMYLTKPPGCEHFSLIEPRSLAAFPTAPLTITWIRIRLGFNHMVDIHYFELQVWPAEQFTIDL